LPPPSYMHNLAPTFVTQAPPTDYNPVIGAIQGLTAKLNEEPRIQNPVTPLSSTVQATQPAPSQSAEQMAGEAALRRAGRTADNFVSHASQVRMAAAVPVATVDFVMPRETIGTNRPTRVVPGEIPREADQAQLKKPDIDPSDPFHALPSHRRAAAEKSDSSLKVSSDSDLDRIKPGEGGGGPPRVLKTPPKVLARSKKQTTERKDRLDSIREKIKRGEQITNQELAFVKKTAGTKKIQDELAKAKK